MNLKDKKCHSTLSVADTFSRNTDNDVQELIRVSITIDIINISYFIRDPNDEVCVLMTYEDEPCYMSLKSQEINTAINWIGRLKGVELEDHDINKIINNLYYYVLIADGDAEFIDDTFQSLGVEI